MRALLALVALATAACLPPFTHDLVPVVSLSSVERPAAARERYGEQVISTRSDSGVTKYSFEDQMIEILFLVRYSDILFDLRNKTDHSLRLLWTETAMVMPEGSVSPVMMNGWKYTDCRAEKPPAVIPKGVTITDFITPCSRLSFYSSWNEAPLFNDGRRAAYDTTVTRVETEMRNVLVGKKLTVLMPLQIEGVTNEYTFTFSVDSIDVRRRVP
ncbi:MAG: hypothetical protein WD771_06380 [Gemmatimonadaceae bacterium]